MARSRIIKPEFWSDEKLAKLSLQARLLYIGLWNTSDDAGTTQGHPLWLKSQIFPYDQISTTQIRRWLQDLVNLGRILPYTVKGEQYYFIPGFLKHQKIQHPSPAKNPAPPRQVCDLFMSGSRPAHEQTETEAETETETEAEQKPKRRRRRRVSSKDFGRHIRRRNRKARPKKRGRPYRPTSRSSTACSPRSGRPCAHPTGKRKAANTYRIPPPGSMPAAGRTRQGLPLPVLFRIGAGPFGRLSSRS